MASLVEESPPASPIKQVGNKYIKKLTDKQRKYYEKYEKIIRPHHVDYELNENKLTMNKFGRPIKSGGDYDDQGIQHAIGVLEELHKNGVYHGDIVSGSKENPKWNRGNILVNVDENRKPEFKLIDFGPTIGENREDDELLEKEKEMLKAKLSAPPSIKKKKRVVSPDFNFGSRIDFSGFSDTDDDEDMNYNNGTPEIIIKRKSPFISHSISPSQNESWSPPKRLKSVARSLWGGKRKTKKKRGRKKRKTKKRKRKKRKKKRKTKKKRGRKKRGSGGVCSRPVRVTPLIVHLNDEPVVVVDSPTNLDIPISNEVILADIYDDGERDAGMIRMRNDLDNRGTVMGNYMRRHYHGFGERRNNNVRRR